MIVTAFPAVPELGAKVTWHVPLAVVQVAAGVNTPVPLPLWEKVTVPPVGVTGVPGDVSVTVAVQTVPAETASVLVAHMTLIEDVRVVAFNPVLPELPACSESPLYVEVMVMDPSLPGDGV